MKLPGISLLIFLIISCASSYSSFACAEGEVHSLLLFSFSGTLKSCYVKAANALRNAGAGDRYVVYTDMDLFFTDRNAPSIEVKCDEDKSVVAISIFGNETDALRFATEFSRQFSQGR